MKDCLKLMKKIRIDNGETLADMAEKLNMSSAYLSQMENGKRNISQSFVKQFEKLYYSTISESRIKDFERITRELITNIVISVDDLSEGKKNIGFKLANRLTNLTKQEEDQILEILEKSKQVNK